MRRADFYEELFCIADRYGGWENVSCPGCEPPEALLQELDDCGIGRQMLISLVNFESLPPREKAIITIAREFLLELVRHRATRVGKPTKRVHISKATWQPLSEIFWQGRMPTMREFDISVAEIESKMIRNTDKYGGITGQLDGITSFYELADIEEPLEPDSDDIAWINYSRSVGRQGHFSRPVRSELEKTHINYIGDSQRRMMRAYVCPNDIPDREQTRISFDVDGNGSITDIIVVEFSADERLTASASNTIRAIKRLRPKPLDLSPKFLASFTKCDIIIHIDAPS